jgi:hypothetical protein
MISLGSVIHAVRTGAKENSATLLTLGAGIGVLSTAYLTAKAAMKSARMIDHAESIHGTAEDPRERFKERTQLVWKEYIPPAIAATTTIVCLVGSNRVSTNKTVAAQTALAVTQSAYSEYRDRAIQEFNGSDKTGGKGRRKDESIRADIAQERVNGNKNNVVVLGEGRQLCEEAYTGRFFECDMDTLKRAVNEINAKLNRHDYATFDDFYYLVGLPQTQVSGNTGWESPKLLALYFSSTMKDDKTALCFEYNYYKAF